MAVALLFQHAHAVLIAQTIIAQRDAADGQGIGDHQIGKDAGDVRGLRIDQRDINVAAPHPQIFRYRGAAKATADHHHTRCRGRSPDRH